MYNRIFEQILREADKSRFLKPLWDKYSDYIDTESIDGIDYNKLLKFVNSDDPILKKMLANDNITWQSNEHHLLWINIINAYKERQEKNKQKQNTKAVYKANTFEEMIKTEKLSLAQQGESAEDVDFVHLSSLDNDTFEFFVPMTYEACVFCDSAKAGGQGAKWCLGYEKTNGYWKDYVENGNLFVFAFNKKEFEKHSATPEDKLKFMIQLHEEPDETCIWKQSDNQDEVIPIYKFESFLGRSAEEIAKTFVNSIMSDDNIYSSNDSGYFYDYDNNEAIIPWKEEDTIETVFLLSDFKSGIYNIEENPEIIDLIKNKTIRDNCFVLDLENQTLKANELHISGLSTETFDLPNFFEWLKKCNITDIEKVIIKNGTLVNVIWEPEASSNTFDIEFINCDLYYVNYIDFSGGGYTFELTESSIDELHWPSEDIDVSTSFIMDKDSYVKNESFEEDDYEDEDDY